MSPMRPRPTRPTPPPARERSVRAERPIKAVASKEKRLPGKRAGWAGRALALAAALLVVLAQAAAFAHDALAGHALLEDGEVVHAAGARIARGGEAGPRTARIARSWSAPLGGGLDARAVPRRDPCLLDSFLRTGNASALPRPPEGAVRPGVIEPRGVQDAWRPVSVALVLIAPKNSPPA